MKLSCSSQMIKYLMFGFNFLFVVSGVIVIAVGTAVKTVYTEYEEFLENKYFSLPNMLIATGAFIFIVSFFGCCGAIKESWIMLGIFSIFLCIIFIFEFACGIAGYVLRDNTSQYLGDTLRSNLKTYNDTHNVWDLIQGTFQCCGVESYADWEDKLGDKYTLPVSCCPMQSGTTGAFYCNSYPISSTTTSNTTISPETTPSSNDIPTTVPPTTVTNSTVEPTTKNDTAEADGNNGRKRRAALRDADTESTSPSTTTNPYEVGCLSAFGDYIKKHAVQIGGCALGLAILQILGIIFSCHLVRQLKNGYYST